MSSETESSIKFTAKADIAEIVQYTQALNENTDAVHRNAEALERHRQAGGAPGFGAAPRSTGGAAVGAPPPPPVDTATGPAPHTGAPPPPPRPYHQVEHEEPTPQFTPDMMRLAAQRAALPGSPPPAQAPAGGPGDAPSAAPVFGGGGGGGGGGRAQQSPGRIQRTIQGAGQRGASFLSQAASTATGVALGTSLTGFFLAAPQRYMQLSRVLEQVSNRFREADGNAATFGQTLGFTIAQGGQLAETLGAVTDATNKEQMQRYLGFSLFTGMDPGQAMGGLGTMERLMGREMSDQGLAGMFMAARRRGMSQGLIGEFVQQATTLAEMQMEATGRVGENDPMALGMLPAMVFGHDDPRRRGGLSLVQGLHQTLTSGAGMRTFMLRAMGYGKEGGPSWIEAQKRLEAGIFDHENLSDLFGGMEARGLGRGRQFDLIRYAAGGALKAHQIEKLVDAFGGEEGAANLAKFREMSEKGVLGGDAEAALTAYLDTYGEKGDIAAYQAEGMAGLGKARVSLGATSDVNLESMMMRLGGPIAKAIPSMQRTLMNMFDAFQNIVGVPWGELIPRLAGNVEKMSQGIESLTAGRGSDMFRMETHGLLPGTSVSARQMAVLRQWGPAAMAKGASVFMAQMGGEAGEAAYNQWYEQERARRSQHAAQDRAGGGL